MKNIFNSLKKSIVKGFWILFLIFGIQSILLLTPYAIVFGLLFLLLSFLTNPWFNNLFSKFNVHLSLKQKWFIGITNFLVAAYSIDISTKSYYRVFISFFIMIIFWVGTIVYSNKKNKDIQK